MNRTIHRIPASYIFWAQLLGVLLISLAAACAPKLRYNRPGDGHDRNVPRVEQGKAITIHWGGAPKARSAGGIAEQGTSLVQHDAGVADGATSFAMNHASEMAIAPEGSGAELNRPASPSADDRLTVESAEHEPSISNVDQVNASTWLKVPRRNHTRELPHDTGSGKLRMRGIKGRGSLLQERVRPEK